MKINGRNLIDVAEELAGDVSGSCTESEVWIGEYEGAVFKLIAIEKNEAEQNHDYENVNKKYFCIEE